jgi:hypothetical protein
MGYPGPDEEAFFARRRQFGLGVGLDVGVILSARYRRTIDEELEVAG